MWSDSDSSLKLINDRTTRFRLYFANRLSKIHGGSSPSNWRFVPSADNPADYNSRGIHAHEKEKWEIFFFGPRFLHLPEEQWPKMELGSIETINMFAMTADEVPIIPSFFADAASGTSFWYWKRQQVAILIRCARR